MLRHEDEVVLSKEDFRRPQQSRKDEVNFSPQLLIYAPGLVKKVDKDGTKIEQDVSSDRRKVFIDFEDVSFDDHMKVLLLLTRMFMTVIDHVEAGRTRLIYICETILDRRLF